MSNENPAKKIKKRGKRGGTKLREGLEEKSVPAATVAPETPSVPAPETPTTDAPAEPPRKKTRRGGQGKKSDIAAPRDLTGPNSVEVGSGHTTQDQAQWDTWDSSNRGGNHWDGRPPQPYFPPMLPDEHHYFITMEKELDNKEFETEEDKAMFVAAMFRELDGKEASVAADPDCSRVLEKMLRASDDFRLRMFTHRLEGQFGQLFRHQFASHVCQTVMYLAADVVDRECKGTSVINPPEEEKDVLATLPTMQQMILTICEQLEAEWSVLMTDAYASHLVRALLNVLSGEPITTEGDRRSKKSQRYNSEHKNTWKENLPARRGVKRSIPAAFTTTLGAITKSVSSGLSTIDLRAYAIHPVANPVLQLLISYGETAESLVNALLSITDSDSCVLEREIYIDGLIIHPVGSHLMEKVLAVARPNLFHQLYITYFRTRLLELCNHSVANFVVQHLIAHTRNGTQLEVLLDELYDSFESLLMRNRAGIIVKIVETCVKHQACQKEVIKAICTAFHATTTDQRRQIVNLILHLQTSETYYAAAKPNLHGSLMLQHMLCFDEEHNKVIIDSFMSLTPNESTAWAFDPVSSRVIEAFLLAPAVSEKAKRKVIRGWLGKFGTLAADKFGSHLVDKSWAVADIGLKEKIAEDLLANLSVLSANHFGKFVVRNCKIESFKRRRDEWIEKEMGIDRKRDMFKEFLGPDGEQTGGESGQGGDGRRSKQKQEVDPLWTTHKFDEGMAALGFGGGRVAATPAEAAKLEKKTKVKKGKADKNGPSKAAQEYEDMEKMALAESDDETAIRTETPAVAALSKESQHEIDNLFQRTKKRQREDERAGRHSRVHDSGDDSDSSGDDRDRPVVAEAAAAPTTDSSGKKTKKMQKDLAGVLEAISATKKKKGSKVKTEDGEVVVRKERKRATSEEGKKKRKFEA
ncbi:Nucleolar protein 9 [Thoreauomyces humboldtii]|nr:Nucleolar protein 9 [Thoreauomyces humboldtii]